MLILFGRLFSLWTLDTLGPLRRQNRLLTGLGLGALTACDSGTVYSSAGFSDLGDFSGGDTLPRKEAGVGENMVSILWGLLAGGRATPQAFGQEALEPKERSELELVSWVTWSMFEPPAPGMWARGTYFRGPFLWRS